MIFLSQLAGANAPVPDQQQTLNIDADATLFDFQKGLDTYTGHVKIIQGSSKILADRMTTQKNAQHKISVIICYGDQQPANYWTTPKAGDKQIHASAHIIKFYPLKSLVKLDGNVIIQQGDNSFHGASIIYDLNKQIVSAPANPKQPSTIIIQPTQLQ